VIVPDGAAGAAVVDWVVVVVAGLEVVDATELVVAGLVVVAATELVVAGWEVVVVTAVDLEVVVVEPPPQAAVNSMTRISSKPRQT